MPERLEEWPIAPSPYDDLLDGSIWKVRLDEYKEVENMNSLRTRIHAAGKKHGYKVRTLKIDENTLVIQAKIPKAKDERKDEMQERRRARVEGG